MAAKILLVLTGASPHALARRGVEASDAPPMLYARVAADVLKAMGAVAACCSHGNRANTLVLATVAHKVAMNGQPHVLHRLVATAAHHHDVSWDLAVFSCDLAVELVGLAGPSGPRGEGVHVRPAQLAEELEVYGVERRTACRAAWPTIWTRHLTRTARWRALEQTPDATNMRGGMIARPRPRIVFINTTVLVNGAEPWDHG
jgi:hypothetical protein